MDGGFILVTVNRSRSEHVRPLSVKDRILESAIEEFAGLGYHGSSLRSIAERSQATKPMIYYHYQGKDGLFAAAIRHQLERLEEELRSRIDDEGDTLARLEAFARTYMACFLFDHPALAAHLLDPTAYPPAPEAQERIWPALRHSLRQLEEALAAAAAGDVENHELKR